MNDCLDSCLLVSSSSEDYTNLKKSIEEVICDIGKNIEISTYHENKFDEYLKNEIYQSFREINFEEFEKIYEDIKEETFFKNNIIGRSYKKNLHIFDHTRKENNQVDYLKSCPQPEQRTDAWYKFRKNHLTGSNSWKIFSTESSRNQLYYEKLEPTVSNPPVQNLNDAAPMNWGHKYESVTLQLYEYYNDVVVEDFGCIEHKNIKYLAASPDGIVTSEKNKGRMIEIKNPTTREITQTPKMEYYIQMQLQMEVCDLNECDFVETKFAEYDSYKDFVNDKYKIEKGVIIVLIKDNLDLVYEYSPLFSNKFKDIDDFTNNVFEKYNFKDDKLHHGRYKWFKNIYWYLNEYSCVYVPRNKPWFEYAKVKIEDFWNNILKEQKNADSYLKYAPKKRQPKKEENGKKEIHDIIKSSDTNKIIVLD
jgi:putative phage-type endonuclease